MSDQNLRRSASRAQAALERYLAPDGDLLELMDFEREIGAALLETDPEPFSATEGLDWDHCFKCGTELSRNGKMVRGSVWRSWGGLSLAVLCHPCGNADER